jgi:hypothetical protein
MKRPDKRVGIFVSEQIRCVDEFERRLAQVMVSHFPTSLFYQALETQSFVEEAPLQRPHTLTRIS